MTRQLCTVRYELRDGQRGFVQNQFIRVESEFIRMIFSNWLFSPQLPPGRGGLGVLDTAHPHN